MDQPPPIAAAAAAADEIVGTSAAASPADSPAAAVEELGAPLFEKMLEELTEDVVYNPATKQYESVEFTPIDQSNESVSRISQSDEEVEEMVGELMDQSTASGIRESEEPESGADGLQSDLEERTSDAAEEAGAPQSEEVERMSDADEEAGAEERMSDAAEEAGAPQSEEVERMSVAAEEASAEERMSDAAEEAGAPQSEEVEERMSDAAEEAGSPQSEEVEERMSDAAENAGAPQSEEVSEASETLVFHSVEQQQLVVGSDRDDSGSPGSDSGEAGGGELDLPVKEAELVCSEQAVAQPVHEELLPTDEEVIAERHDQERLLTAVEEVGDPGVEDASEAIGTMHSHPSPARVEESEAPESVEEGGAAELDFAAPHTDSELPSGSALELEASTEEQGGAEAVDAEEVSTSQHEEMTGEANEMDDENSPAFEQPGQEESLPTDAEEATTTQHEETVGEVNEMDDEKTHNTGTTALSTALMDESSDSDDAGAKLCEEEPDDTDVPLHHSSRVAAANNDAAIDAYLMDAEGEKPMTDSPPRSRGRRKRGRPPKAQPTKTPTKTPTKKRKEKEGEELCFICFDGGELVVCNRRGCPKVYHPSCVNRDEAFFRAKGRWTCGWHICSNCQKSAHYLCYTCTFSLCKSCIDESGFVLVRDKGFCATCISTVILIESRECGRKKMDEINFDDKSSWMYLFKNYWLDLKRKLSFTLEELTRAKALHEDSDAMSEDLDTANGVERDSSDSSTDRVEVGISSKKKAKKRDRSITNAESSVKDAESEETSVSDDAGWASKELLEFVAHLKDGDTSARTQFEVQNLLLNYVEQNKLRDPRAKSQIVCDALLQNLFGKTRIGHFEMLKLLDSHFPVKVPSPVVTDDNQGGVLDPDPSQMDTEGNSDASTIMSSDRRRRMHNRLREKEPQTNLHDYAAIDVHNITLIYLRRNLMEDLIDDIETFSDKVVGAFARIRIPGTGLYRLVQVVGTGKATKAYNTGRKNTDVNLQILNLDKTEFINIDIISNQEFSEEECKRLRQSIKCGFIGRLTVGEIQEKARDLQAVRVKDWLENEKLRLNNLRDRASEQGRRKQLRECVEKLQLLNTPTERMRRLNEVPEIHADPKMDPDYESPEDEEDDKKPDNPDNKREAFFLGRRDDAISSVKGDLDNTWNSARKNYRSRWEPKKNLPEENWWDIGSSTNAGTRPNESSFHQEEQVHQTSNSPAMKSGYSSAVPSATLSTPSLAGSVAVVPSNTSETDKIWHYKDPSQKIQGPFSLAQLRKWNSTGYFPANMGIWRTSERPEDSILLTDALMGKFQKDLPELHTQRTQNAEAVNLIDGKNESSSSWRGRNDYTSADNYQNFVNRRAAHNDAGAVKDERFGMTSRGWQPNDYNAPRSGQPQGPYNPRAAPQFSGSHRSPSYNGRGGRGRWNAQESVRNVPAESVNVEALTNNSIAPSMNSNAWDANTVPASNNQHNSLMIPIPVNSQPSMSFQGVAAPAGQTAQTQGETLQNSSIILGPAAQTNASFGWGAVTEGNMSVVWGIPAQGNANLSTTWGTPVQANPGSNTGWGAAAQGDIRGTQTQGNINQIATWPVQQGNITSINTSQGSMNQNVGWGGDGSMNAGQGNTDITWNSRLSGRENQSGDWQPGQSERQFQRSNYGNGGGRPSWNSGEGSSRPPGGGESGICRFYHELGHCRKGRQCNYRH